MRFLPSEDPAQSKGDSPARASHKSAPDKTSQKTLHCKMLGHSDGCQHHRHCTESRAKGCCAILTNAADIRVDRVSEPSMNSLIPAKTTPDPPNPGASPRQPTFTRSVAGRDVLVAFAATVLPALFTLALVLLIGVALEQDWLISLVVPLATLASCSGMWAALGRSGWSFRDLGFVRARRSAWHFLWEIPLAWIAAVALTFLVGTFVGLDPSGADSASNSTTALQVGVWSLVLTSLCTVIVMPAVEEILFRRILFGWLERRTSVVAAVIGSAIFFGAAHIAPPVVLLQFLIGLAAATLVYVHRTLWASLALHVFNNGIVTAIVIATVL